MTFAVFPIFVEKTGDFKVKYSWGGWCQSCRIRRSSETCFNNTSSSWFRLGDAIKCMNLRKCFFYYTSSLVVIKKTSVILWWELVQQFCCYFLSNVVLWSNCFRSLHNFSILKLVSGLLTMQQCMLFNKRIYWFQSFWILFFATENLSSKGKLGPEVLSSCWTKEVMILLKLPRPHQTSAPIRLVNNIDDLVSIISADLVIDFPVSCSIG